MKAARKKILTLDGEITNNTTDINDDKLPGSSDNRSPLSYGALEIGFAIALPIAGGVLFGSFVDSKFGTAPKYTLIFLFIGIFIGFSNIFWIIKKISNP